MQRPLRFALFALLGACTIKGVDLGDLDTDQGSGGDDGAPDDASSSAAASITVSGADGIGPVLPDIGRPCDHGLDPEHVPESRLVTSPAPACGGDICVYVDTSVAPLGQCSTDAECNVVNGDDRFTCDPATGTCALDFDYVLARSMCSAACESDADCVPDGETNCITGFSCVPMSSVGSVCCVPMCACNDDLDAALVQDLQQSCTSGTAEACCNEHPGQGLCPG